MKIRTDIKNILLLDDDQDYRNLLKTLLAEHFQDVEFHEYDPIEKGEPDDDFDWSKFDVLLLDYYLCIHGLDGLDIFNKHQGKKDFPATILLTAAGNEELAIRTLKSGIKDYVRKDKLNAAMLAEAIINAYETHHRELNLQDEVRKSEAQLQKDRAELEKEAAILNSQIQG